MIHQLGSRNDHLKCIASRSALFGARSVERRSHARTNRVRPPAHRRETTTRGHSHWRQRRHTCRLLQEAVKSVPRRSCFTMRVPSAGLTPSSPMFYLPRLRNGMSGPFATAAVAARETSLCGPIEGRDRAGARDRLPPRHVGRCPDGGLRAPYPALPGEGGQRSER